MIFIPYDSEFIFIKIKCEKYTKDIHRASMQRTRNRCCESIIRKYARSLLLISLSHIIMQLIFIQIYVAATKQSYKYKIGSNCGQN